MVRTNCLVCGGWGFSVAFEYCKKCQIWAVHRYCLDKVPNFDEEVVWFCKDCDPKPISDVPPAKSSSPILKPISEAPVAKSSSPKSKKRTKSKKKKQARKPPTNNENNNMDDEASLSDLEILIEDAERGKNHDNGDQLGAPVELDGDLSKKNTSIEDNVAPTDPIAVQEDSDEVPDPVKHAGGDVQLSNSGVTSDPEQREQDGGLPNENAELPNENAEIANVEIPIVAVENPVQEPFPPAEPNREPVWIGSFHLRDKKFGIIEGIMAHLSTIAGKKVRVTATSLPVLLSLELLPLRYMWPKSFEESGPSDRSIALYFFPNNEETEKIFDSLVDKMMSQHLGMKATLEVAELLIFTSSLLPLEFRRYQSKYYLWGVFRSKQPPYQAKVDPVVAKDHMDSSIGRSPTPVSNVSSS